MLHATMAVRDRRREPSRTRRAGHGTPVLDDAGRCLVQVVALASLALGTACDGEIAVEVRDDDDESTRSGLLFIADNAENERYLVVAARSGTVVREVALDELDPEHCARHPGAGVENLCLPYELDHRVGDDGRDRILAMYSPMYLYENGSLQMLSTVLASIVLEDPPVVEWFVDRIDLSDLESDPSEFICPLDIESPCDEDPDQVGAAFGCALRKAHAFSVLEERDGELRLVVADNRNQRILELTVTEGDRCAHVDAVYAPDNLSDWTVYRNPNDIEAYLDEGTVHLLLSIKDSTWDNPESGATDRGKLLHLVREEGGEPRTAWVFPPVDTNEPSFLNSQHNIDIAVSATGARYALVAHSDGMGPSWYAGGSPDDAAGSILLLSCCDDAPTYLADVRLPVESERTLGYLRDVDILDDGTVLVTDSGCVYPDGCTREPWVGELSMPSYDEIRAMDLPSKTGNWTDDHSTQNVVDAAISDVYLDAPFLDVGLSVYEADYVPAEDLGSLLSPLCP